MLVVAGGAYINDWHRTVSVLDESGLPGTEWKQLSRYLPFSNGITGHRITLIGSQLIMSGGYAWQLVGNNKQYTEHTGKE